MEQMTHFTQTDMCQQKRFVSQLLVLQLYSLLFYVVE